MLIEIEINFFNSVFIFILSKSLMDNTRDSINQIDQIADYNNWQMDQPQRAHLESAIKQFLFEEISTKDYSLQEVQNFTRQSLVEAVRILGDLISDYMTKDTPAAIIEELRGQIKKDSTQMVQDSLVLSEDSSSEYMLLSKISKVLVDESNHFPNTESADESILLQQQAYGDSDSLLMNVTLPPQEIKAYQSMLLSLTTPDVQAYEQMLLSMTSSQNQPLDGIPWTKSTFEEPQPNFQKKQEKPVIRLKPNKNKKKQQK